MTWSQEAQEEHQAALEQRWADEQRRVDTLAELAAHVNAATARWLDAMLEIRECGSGTDLVAFVAYRCGVNAREAREFIRVGDALQELPLTKAAFARGELTFTKVRSLTRVATPAAEESLLELAYAVTASQLERALRAFRRMALEDARRAHALEYVNYHFGDDGSLYLRARLSAEEGTLLVKALDAAKDRVLRRRRAELAAAREAGTDDTTLAHEPIRPAAVEALVALVARDVRADDEAEEPLATRVVVHVDAAALASDAGRSELEDGPVIPLETARRLGCDAEVVAHIERDGLPISVGRTRRTVPPTLRRVLEARDESTCCFPGCERRRHLQAHHRQHWAHGGDTSLDNLVLLCFDHHRLVHEGGYTIEEDEAGGGLRFRNRHGLINSTRPPPPRPGSLDELIDQHRALGLEIGPRTNRNGGAGGIDPFDLGMAVYAVSQAFVRNREAQPALV